MSELTLGQREIGMGDALTSEEVEYVQKNGVNLLAIQQVLGITNSRMTIDAAIGGALNVRRAFEGDLEVADPRGLGVKPE